MPRLARDRERELNATAISFVSVKLIVTVVDR